MIACVKLLTRDVKIVRSLPGMGLVLAAEFLAEAGDPARFGSADRLAAAAGISPVLQSSGKTSYRRRARRGSRILKRVFYQSALLALARRRVNVLCGRCCATGLSTSSEDPGQLDNEIRMPYVRLASAVLLLLAGAYIVYYWLSSGSAVALPG